MGMRVWNVTADILVDLVKAVKSDRLFNLRCTRGHLPEDAKIVAVRHSPYWHECVEIRLESEQWGKDGDGERVEPMIQAIWPDPTPPNS